MYLVILLIGLANLTSSLQSAQAAPLQQNPTYVYQTIYNGAEFDSGRGEVVDNDGNAYIIARAYDSSNDVMVVKISPSGNVLFTTYLRGSLNDYATGLALDGQGSLWISGWTDSTDFPIVNAAQPVKDNRRSGFLAKILTSDGTIAYSSFFGAGGADEFQGIAIAPTGDIYVVGKTDSTDFPTVNPIQGGLNLTSCFCDDAFVMHLAPDAHTILFSTYLGGEVDDEADSIGLDAAGNLYVAGITKSDGFPTVNPIQSSRSGASDLWVARISADGSNLDYSTYLGGSQVEYLANIAVDTVGYVTLAGTTNSVDFPSTPASYQPVFGGGLCGVAGFGQRSCYDGFVTRIAPDGSSLAYSTFFGNGNDDEARDVVVDADGNAYFVGYTYTTDVPPNVFIYTTSLDASGSQLRFLVTEFSAVANDGHGIALGPDGDVYITGAMNAPSDLYAARLTANGNPLPTETPTPVPTSTSVPPTATPTPPPSSNEIHVGDLDGSTISKGFRGWRPNVSILVHDQNEKPAANVTVSGLWSNLNGEIVSCVTDANGLCSINNKNLRRSYSSVTFTIVDLTQSGYTYNAVFNHDPDGDSNGTSIVISRP